MKQSLGPFQVDFILGCMERTWPKGLEPGSGKNSDSAASFGENGWTQFSFKHFKEAIF